MECICSGRITAGTPWIKVNPNYSFINVESQEKDPNSVLNYFRNIVKLRKENPALTYGRYTLLDKENPDVFAYTREAEHQKFLVLLNFKNHEADFHSTMDMNKIKIMLGNYAKPFNGGKLSPYEAVVFELK